MTAAVIFAMGLYNAPAFNEAVSSAKKVKGFFKILKPKEIKEIQNKNKY